MVVTAPGASMQLLNIACSAILSLSLLAQSKPDFSGPAPQRLTIKQDAQKLRVEQRGDRGTSTVVYDLEGKAAVNQMPVGGGGNSMPASFRCKWNGASLVTAISVQGAMQAVAGEQAAGAGGV